MPESDVPQTHQPTATSQARLNDLAGYFSRRAKLADKYNIRHDEMRELDAEVDMALTAALLRVSGYRWVPASEGEPPVTDKRFAVLLISYEDVDFYTKQKYAARYLRPHYPGSSPNEIPADCHWLLLPPIPV